MPHFRVVGLTATPGWTLESIQGVLTNLCIAKIAVKDEDDADVTKYTHVRTIVRETISLGSELTSFANMYAEMMRPFVDRLHRAGVLSIQDPFFVRFSIPASGCAVLEDVITLRWKNRSWMYLRVFVLLAGRKMCVLCERGNPNNNYTHQNKFI